MCNGESQIPKKEKPLSKILGIYYNYGCGTIET
jgi:hypothetical protein